jgi:starch synthase
VTPAILFEPDGYLLNGRQLMGRQSAGNGFLRAAVKGRQGDEPLVGYTHLAASAEIFQKAVAEIDPGARTEWIARHRLDLLAEAGALYRPDLALGPAADQRLRVGPAAYSLCGVTHTLATDRSLDAIGDLLTAPVMPWDALICTSSAALSVVTEVLDHQADYLRWRTAGAFAAPRPLLPIIPLGVHCEDYAFTAADRQAARLSLAIGPQEVVAVSAGRLSVHSKAHPYAMLSALQDVATNTKAQLVLIFAGQAFNKAIANLFETAASTIAPDVRTLFVDGKDLDGYRGAWAAADLFISLSDSIQETFGLTPIEAMAAGLPALVSDWNGYKDTVREGVDGFRVATWTPPPGRSQAVAQRYELGLSSYDEYLYETSSAVAVDMGRLLQRLTELVVNPGLRQRMGEAGQARARSEFDWSVVFARYQALWREQTQARRHALADPEVRARLSAAPSRATSHRGPFDTFAAYPTDHVGPQTQVTLSSDLDVDGYRAFVAAPILARMHVAPAIFGGLRVALGGGPATVSALARATGIDEGPLSEAVARLAKIGLLALS